MNRISNNFFLGSILSLCFGNIAVAAWSSGGGQFIKDAYNPWFIQNTPVVSYCIIHDNAHFQLNEEEGFPLEVHVENAILFWKNEFKNAFNPLGNTKDGVKVATQNFVKTNCNDQTDIQFQFGYLSSRQMDEMKKIALDPKGYVSLAVRTEYDPKHLKGKGFIYLAADSGPLRPQSPDSDEMMAHPWAEGSGSFIYKVLVHELGHVFGLQHQSNLLSFMAPEYPESLVRKNGTQSGYAYYLPSFFIYSQPEDYSFCQNIEIDLIAVKFFGLPSDWYCYSTEFRDHELKVWAKSNRNSEKILIGTAQFETNVISNYELPISLWLPNLQAVYPPNPKRTSKILYGAMITHSHFKGVYKNKSGDIERQISLYLSPTVGWNKMGGILDGQLLIDIQRNN